MELTDLGKAPVSENQPVGEDITYDPLFEELSGEIDKLSSPTATEAVDWRKVNRLASTILAEKSKDIRVACHLSVAQIHLSGYQGFEIGLKVLGDMIDLYWETLYPSKKRMRGRAGVLAWWVEKAEAILIKESPPVLPPETVEALKSGIDRMIRLFDEKVPESPSLMSLKRFFHSLPSAEEKPPEPAKPPSENAPAVSPAAAQIPSPKPVPSPPEPAVSPVIDTLQDAEKTVREALTLIRKAAGCFREKDLMNPIGYRLNRIAAWTNSQFLPPVADGKKTRLPPPDPHVSSNLRIFRENGKYESLIALAENEQSRYIFWLDLSRYVSEALASMGDRYKGASDAVNLETALFVQRLKGLEEMAFSDGMPFADADTLKWLEGLAVGTSASFAPAPPAVPAGEVPESQGDMARKVAEAHLLLKKNEIYQAISMIQDELRRSGSCREKMKWRLALVQLLLASKKGSIALAHAETILKDIETYRLEQWDPEVAAQGLKMAWMVMTHQPEAELKEKAWNILCRLAALDPADASRLSK